MDWAIFPLASSHRPRSFFWRLTGDGVDGVFDGIGGDNLWRSRAALREGGRVVTYGFQSKMRQGRMASGSEGRHPFRESAELGWFIVRNWFKSGRKRMVPYSIQWLMRFKPAWFRHDLLTLLDLLKQGKIKPLISQRLPLEEARRAHEMLGEGGVLGRSCCCRTASGNMAPGHRVSGGGWTMKALIRERYGPPDVLEVRDIERPAPKEREVLVRVHAASINDWDWQMLQPPTLPLASKTPRVRILGSDIAGRVAAIGREVQRFTIGDEVYGDLSRFRTGGWGGFAEYVCAPEGALVRKPPRMTFEQAAALPQAGQLAVQGLFAAGSLRSGQKILINGAGGGVGTIAIQLAKSHDVEVTGVDSAVKFEMMRAIGFDHVIDYRKENFAKNGQRYDLILDTKTTRSPFAYTRSLSSEGTYATVGGNMFQLLQFPIFGWCIQKTRGKTVRLIMLKQNRDLPYLNERFEAGHLIPVIDGPYKLSEAREAFRHFGAGTHKGKVIITMD